MTSPQNLKKKLFLMVKFMTENHGSCLDVHVIDSFLFSCANFLSHF